MKTESTTIDDTVYDTTVLNTLRNQITEKWEIEGIGQFLLGLRDRNVFYNVEGTLILKKRVKRQEFDKYLNTTNNITLKAQFEEKLGPYINGS